MKNISGFTFGEIVKKSLFFSFIFSIALFSQTTLPISEKFNPVETLTPEKCYDLIKTVWDGLKKISEEYTENGTEKSEFETTAEYNERVRKLKDQYINKIRKYSLETKLDSVVYSAWFKAELVKYDADNQVYSVKSSTQILVQPKKQDIEVVVPSNKYVTIVEKNHGGYRRANLQLSTEPDFSWFVNKQTAQSAKNKAGQIYFKVWFTFNTFVNEIDNQIVLQIIPLKIALMDQQENFTYWSEEIR